MRVVISGMAALTPIGNGLEAFARGLLQGDNGVAPIRRFDATRHRVQRAAEVAWEKPAASPYSRASEMALAASAAALADAGLDRDALADLRVDTVLASSQGGMAVDAASYKRTAFPYRERRTEGELAIRMLDTAPASTLDLLTSSVGAHGLALHLSTACSAGLHALGLAAQAVRTGQADAVVVTGVETLVEFTLAGFGVLRALTLEDGPRPFDVRRDGTTLGEGAAAMVIESEARAVERGQRYWGEIAGYGSSTDAVHMTRPDAAGPARAMAQALEDIEPGEVSWVKAHGTGTRLNDEAEAQAIRHVFGSRCDSLPVTSFKSMLGHSLGASGVVEAVGVVLALAGGFIPPTPNLEQFDPALELDLVSTAARTQPGRYVLANAFGFGGNNASVVLGAAFN